MRTTPTRALARDTRVRRALEEVGRAQSVPGEAFRRGQRTLSFSAVGAEAAAPLPA